MGNYRKARERKGYTAQEAATRLGVSITTLGSWEFQSTLPLRGATATYCIVKVLDVKICRTASRIGGIPTS